MAYQAVGGNEAIDRGSYSYAWYTFIDLENPISEDCTLKRLELYWTWSSSDTTSKLVIFRDTGTQYESIAVYNLPTTHNNGFQSFDIDIAVQSGDLVGIYSSGNGGSIDMDTSGGTNGLDYKVGDASGTTSDKTDWTNISANILSIQVFKEVADATTVWYNINADIRVLNSGLYDINGDIRVVSQKESLRDVNCNIITSKRFFYDANCDIRVLSDYDRIYDMSCDIRVLDSPFRDINCDIRVTQEGGEYPGFLPDIDCDIRVLSRNIYNINADIRVQEDKKLIYDINCDIRVISAPPDGVPLPSPGEIKIAPKSVGLSGFRVYLDSVEIEDVSLDSIEWNWTFNESPASASFRIIRKSDNFNKTLEGVTQAINTNIPIEIKFDGKLKYYGYIMDIDVENSGESVIVSCLDRKQKIQDELYSMSYGKKWEFPEQGKLEIIEGDYITTGQAITYILDQLITDGIISSYSGVPDGIIPEYQEIQDMPPGALLTELLDLSGNYYWNITPNGKLEIYEGGIGSTKSLPVQETNKQLFLYDVLNYNLRLNDRNNLITSLEVTMGTESEEERASYRIVNAGTPSPDWTGSGKLYDELLYSSDKIPFIGALIDMFRKLQLWSRANPDESKEVGTKYRIAGWTEGSFIDDTFKPYVIGFNKYKIGGWSWGGEYLTLSQPLIKIKRITKEWIQDVGSYTIHVEKKFQTPKLVGRFYKKETINIAENPSIFDVSWVGIGGVGSKRKVTFSQLGVRDNIGWIAYEEDKLVAKSEPGYNDTEYATDRANLILSKINDPVTEGTINLTFDAFEYYGLNIGNRVNLSGTNEVNIYSDNNGFPLDIMSINFNAGSYIVTLNVSHLRNFRATKNYR